MALLEKALLVNPDPLYLWNHRREWILFLDSASCKSEEGSDEGSFSSPSALESELALTQASLHRNPKAYGAWMHRKWILQFVKAPATLLKSELQLTVEFLKLDERNFHCWNYRRFVVGCLANAETGCHSYDGRWGNPTMGVQLVPTATSTVESVDDHHSRFLPPELLQTEWDFTTKKIHDNFSNFSAFFYRAELLPRYLEIHASNKKVICIEELQLMEDACCTEPDDQTAWWYQSLLLSFGENIIPLDLLRDRLVEQTDLLRELLQDSPNSKWVLLGLHRLLDKLSINPVEQCTILRRLQQVDPDRSQRYQELLDQVQIPE